MWIVYTLVIVVVIGIFFLLFARKSPNVNLVASPSAATILLDGNKRLQPGKVYISPGKHRLVASFNGFATRTIVFSSSTGLTEVDVILEPNSQVGYDWLNTHPDDVGVRQNIGGRNYNNSAQTLLREFPIVANLPTYGPGSEYEISYGSVTNTSGSSKLEIDIIYYTQAGKQAGLQWLQSQPYGMNKFNVKYIDKTSDQPVVDNPGTH